jgi:hypothetical protein
MKKWGIILGISLLHAVISFGFFLFSIGITSHHMDDGAPYSIAEKATIALSRILFAPIVYPLLLRAHLGSVFGGLLGYIPIIVNSLVWGIAFWIVYSWLKCKLQIPKQAPRHRV